MCNFTVKCTVFGIIFERHSIQKFGLVHKNNAGLFHIQPQLWVNYGLTQLLGSNFNKKNK